MPKLYHVLILDRVKASELKEFYIRVRKSVRAWLRFPHDMPKLMFSNAVREGGLGMQCLQRCILIMRRSRLNIFIVLAESDPILKYIVDYSLAYRG